MERWKSRKLTQSEVYQMYENAMEGSASCCEQIPQVVIFDTFSASWGGCVCALSRVTANAPIGHLKAWMGQCDAYVRESTAQ
eukprot:2662469-Amphidinium_carterae.1